MIKSAPLVLVGLFAATAPTFGTTAARSRPAAKGCTWEKLSDVALGLDAWVQRCAFGSRKIDFVVANGSLAIRYSDGGAPEPLVDVLPLQAGETPEAGMQRIFAAHTDKAIASRCVLKPYTRNGKTPAGVKRFAFVPNAAYQKELDAKSTPAEVPDAGCGDWGDTPDGIQYFEAQPASGARKVLFVRVGQDEPLFDEATLRLLPPAKTSR